MKELSAFKRINLSKCYDIGSRMTHFGLPRVKYCDTLSCRGNTMTQGHDRFLYYSTGYKHLAGMIWPEINSVSTRTVLCSRPGTLQGRLFRHDNASCCCPFALFRFSGFASMSVKTAVSSTRHAAICWRFGEPQGAAVVARLSILPELGARRAYRTTSSQICKQRALRANTLSGEQSNRIN
jgi:hypothetical protein